MELKFPKGFLWGAATSAHQVEGGNNNDWTEWEKENAGRLAREAKNRWQPWQQEKFPEMLRPENYVSGRACGHYNLFREDFDLAKSLGHSAYRLSLEWSRIEPEEGKFNEEEIEHYRQVLSALKERGLEPFVTLWHWTNPLWFSRLGGWRNLKAEKYFQRYCRKITKAFGNLARFYITLNEPDIYIMNSYQRGIWPPQKRNFGLVKVVLRNLVRAHKLAYEAIHESAAGAQAGIAKNNVYFSGWPLSFLADFLWNHQILIRIRNHQDFIGLNYYFHRHFSKNEDKEITDMGWEIYPEGIYRVLKGLKKYGKPVYVTENGLADAEDGKRKDFIKNHLIWIHKAIQEGVDVRGYFHWSLLDNFEWDKGFWPRFGLFEVNYQTLERRKRPSADYYASICQNNGLENS